MKYHILLHGVQVGEAETLEEARVFIKEACEINKQLIWNFDIKEAKNQPPNGWQ